MYGFDIVVLVAVIGCSPVDFILHSDMEKEREKEIERQREGEKRGVEMMVKYTDSA